MSRLVKAAVTTKSRPIPFIKHIQLQPAKEDEVVVKVTASGYHHLVRGRASGNHYSVLGGEDDRIVGVDGVGYIEGKNDLVYFTTFAPGLGSYAEYVNVKKENVHQFPSNYTSKEAIARVAALSNGVMSSYFALGPRMPTLVKNPIVAILGVTGTSGQLAIQVSKNIFNAQKVIGISRSGQDLRELQQNQPLLDEIVSFEENDQDIIRSGKLDEVDVVLDYVWGEPALRSMGNFINSRKDKTKSLTWIQIGQMSGAEVSVPAAYLRSANFSILGSGLGPLTDSEMSDVFKEVTVALAEGTLYSKIEAVPIEDIETEWKKPFSKSVRKYFTFTD